MSDVLIGATLPQFSGDRERLIESVRAAENAGLDSIWLFDHLWPLSGGKDRAVLECWTALAWLAAATTSIRIGTLVTRSSLRHPALLAKMAATVAAIAPGRLIVALGSGDEASRAENEAFGIPYYAGAERIEQLTVAAGILRGFLEGDEISCDSPYAEVQALVPSPRPLVRPTVWLGGRSDDVLSIAARSAHGWNAWGGTPSGFARDAQQVLRYAAGRRIELSWGGTGVLARTDAEAEASPGATGRRIVGGPGTVASRLQEFVSAGARHVILTPAGSTAEPGFYALLADAGSRLVT